ncbi:MAG: bifunctional nuclease family protein [Chloroflexi bacterium]|nr:bifunctional nuclease family protein [Chloroflexota bacterium]
MIEMVVESVRVNLQTYQRVVVLKEKSADRYLPIWIGSNEADAIVIQLQNVPVPRPQTHDLLKSVILELGATLSKIVVTDLADDVFYARILIDLGGKHVEVDSRPSDAIALAVRLKAPIFVEDVVLEKAAITLDADSVEEQIERVERIETKPSEVKVEELKKLSAFREFINTLNLDDFDKGEKGGGKEEKGEPR